MRRSYASLPELAPGVTEMDSPLAPIADRVVLNTKSIGRLARWGCFSSDVKIGVQAEPATDTLVTYGFHVREAPQNVLRTLMHGRPTLTLDINVPIIQAELERTEAYSHDPRPWAWQIQRGIKSGLRNASREHLLDSPSTNGEFLPWYVTTAAASLLTSCELMFLDSRLRSLDLGTYGMIFGGVALSTLLMTNASKPIMNKLLGERMRDSCYSLLPGFHADRLAALYGSSALQRLVRAI